jgi:glycolate oxidase iron-sulfur subunit
MPEVAVPDAERPVVAIQDPCHLRHVQRTHAAVRTVLSPVASLAELDDEGLCCGAGGAYAAVQPALATAIRDRKLAAIARAGNPVVASANPGCALHLAAAGVDVVHPCTLLARALTRTGSPYFAGRLTGAYAEGELDRLRDEWD